MQQQRLPPCSLVAGKYHTVCIDEKDGAAYSWGGGGRELPPPPKDDPRKQRKQPQQQVQPSAFAAEVGEGSTSSSRPLQLHHLGHGETSGSSFVPRPRRIAGLRDVKVIELSTGTSHLMLRTESGDIFSCGDGAYGRLGHGTDESAATPRLIEGLQTERYGKAVQVSAGEWHSLILSESGWVYSFGSGVNGRHGHGDATNQWLPRALWTGLSNETIRDVNAGISHSLVITVLGELFTWGAGGSGQLGLGEVNATYQRRVPTKVDLLDGVPVKQGSCGSAHTLVVTETGELYSFGFGSFGRLGHGDRSDQHMPKRVEGPLLGQAVRFASAGFDHSVVLTERGQVYTFGGDTHGKLGHGFSTSLTLPKAVQSHLETSYGEGQLARQAAKDVLRVYSFGPNQSKDFGAPTDIVIGHGQDNSEALPTRVEALLNLEVIEVAAGHEHTVVRIGHGKDGKWLGELRAFGSNQTGQLGLPWLADQGDKCLPARVEWPQEPEIEEREPTPPPTPPEFPPAPPRGWYPVSRN